jgi:dienelactone hydrolase
MIRVLLAVLLWAASASAQEPSLAHKLREVDTGVIVRGKVRVQPLAGMIARDVEARLREANRINAEAWAKVKTLDDWKRFRDERLRDLRNSLGPTHERQSVPSVRITRTLEGDGYRIHNVVYPNGRGLYVTANLYRPANPAASMPGILISHSHGAPKSAGTRQDMAMTWARAGCVVLVPDHLGHGERQQHPFGNEPQADYHGRYDMGMQLHLVGDSLMGWMAHDLMCGIDVLLDHKGVDAKRIVLISDPAGGGDIGAVAAALDSRITCALINNFGGPEPENAYPLPRDAERSFDYAGSGSWESTRNLRLSARDGFLPWVILASCAPRKLIYYHEFYWDREQDPVWKRLQRVYELHDASDQLAGFGGRGFVVGNPPDNTHWIALNREIVYPLFERWFAIPNPKKEYRNQRPIEDLDCLTVALKKELDPRPLHELLGKLAKDYTTTLRAAHALRPTERAGNLQAKWRDVLGNTEVSGPPTPQGLPEPPQSIGDVKLERIHLRTEPGIVVPALLLIPASKTPPPVVLGVSQHGKHEFLRQRAGVIAELLTSGIAVCLPDVRGTGESSPGDDRGRRGTATNVSSSEWMLGQSLLGGRLRDVRSVLAHLRQRKDVDATSVALWGESFAPVNPAGKDLAAPHMAAKRPHLAEPLGGLLALLAALYEDDVRGILVHGGLCDYASIYEGPQGHLPHDAIVPGVISVTGDLPLLAAALAPRPLWLDGLVDAQNRPVAADKLRSRYTAALKSYKKVPERLRLGEPAVTDAALARWFLENLKK